MLQLRRVIEKTLKNEYDKCFLLSADNDFSSAIKRAKEINPTKKIIIQPPPLPQKKIPLKKEYAIDNLEHSSGCKALLTNFYTILKHQFEDEFEELKNPWKIQQLIQKFKFIYCLNLYLSETYQ